MRTWSERPYERTWIPGKKEVTTNPLRAFIEYLLYETNRSYGTVALAHYAGKFDLQLILGELYRSQPGIMPTMIRSGNKIFQAEVGERLRFFIECEL